MFDYSKMREKARFFYGLAYRTEAVYSLLARQYREQILDAERQRDPKSLTPYGWSAFSQSDEDGILEEIFRRIGSTNRRLIDFGCAEGLENNTTYMVLNGWNALWMDGGEENVRIAREQFSTYVKAGTLRIEQQFLTRENIDELITRFGFGGEIDLLSIDIDGNDYWLWEAVTAARPRAVIIEYNAVFRPPMKITQAYNPTHVWDGSNYHGASLSAMEQLGRKKGFALVGCSFSGANAYFVREDLLGDHFSAPFTAEHHYREPFLDAFVRGQSRHRRGMGPYVLLD